MYINNFLSTNPTTLILSSLVSEFLNESESEKKWEGEGALIPKQYVRLCQLR